MKAMTANDTCFSTLKKGRYSSVFNTDGREREVIDVAEARTAFDFRIEKHQSFDENGNALPGHFHLRRDTDGAFIPTGAIGDRFVPVQHLDVFDYIVNKVMPEVPQMKLETVGTLYGAGTGIVTATMGDEFRLPGDDSPQRNRLFFANPCGRGSLVIGFTSVRVFCQNCIAAARRDVRGSETGFAIRHTAGAGLNVQAALDTIRSQAHAAERLRSRCEWLTRLSVTGATLQRALDAIHPLRFDEGTPARGRIEAKREAVVRQFEGGETALTMKGDTAWKLFNAFTYPIFNPERTSERNDLADISYRGQLGGLAGRVESILSTVERIAA